MAIKYGPKIAKYGHKYGNKAKIWAKFSKIWRQNLSKKAKNIRKIVVNQ